MILVSTLSSFNICPRTSGAGRRQYALVIGPQDTWSYSECRSISPTGASSGMPHGEKAVIPGGKDDEGRLRADFELKADELYIYLTPGGEVRLLGSIDTHYYLVFWSNYEEVKALLERAVLKEFTHFVDGTLLMPERTVDIFPDERNIVWKI